MNNNSIKKINAILLLYNHPIRQNAPTIMEHVASFEKYSRFKVWNVNVLYGFPQKLYKYNFSIIILHYSLFGSYPFKLNNEFIKYISTSEISRKIAFFQDEHQYCRSRFDLVNNLRIDVIYSLLDPKYSKSVYLSHTNTKFIRHTLTGYVDDSLIEHGCTLYKSERQREIDIGYRARPLAYELGKGAQEKTMIADEFVQRLASSNMVLDIKTSERDRIYGSAWYEFVANCRGMIGVEAGVSIFDLEGKVRSKCTEYLSQKPNATFEEVYHSILLPWEENIYYRTISPRIFEAAAFRVCMILFEGRYNDILQPMVHYIPLKKDFSNFEWVISVFKNLEERRRLTDNSYRDLIESGQYSYRKFITDFDEELLKAGCHPNISVRDIANITSELQKGRFIRLLLLKLKLIRYAPFPGRMLLKYLEDLFLNKYRRVKLYKFHQGQ